jgi:hypothetical protein
MVSWTTLYHYRSQFVAPQFVEPKLYPTPNHKFLPINREKESGDKISKSLITLRELIDLNRYFP